jgi:hypothetical protein
MWPWEKRDQPLFARAPPLQFRVGLTRMLFNGKFNSIDSRYVSQGKGMTIRGGPFKAGKYYS